MQIGSRCNRQVIVPGTAHVQLQGMSVILQVQFSALQITPEGFREDIAVFSNNDLRHIFPEKREFNNPGYGGQIDLSGIDIGFTPEQIRF